MKAIFPGSFDPFTNGHLDILSRALKIFDQVNVAVLSNSTKASLFDSEERVGLISEVCQEFGERVVVESFGGLLVDYARDRKIRVVLRGLRAISDYDYEMQLALMNKGLWQDIETFFLITSEPYSYVSSTIVKQVAQYGGDISRLVPEPISVALGKKITVIAEP